MSSTSLARPGLYEAAPWQKYHADIHGLFLIRVLATSLLPLSPEPVPKLTSAHGRQAIRPGHECPTHTQPALASGTWPRRRRQRARQRICWRRRPGPRRASEPRCRSRCHHPGHRHGRGCLAAERRQRGLSRRSVRPVLCPEPGRPACAATAHHQSRCVHLSLSPRLTRHPRLCPALFGPRGSGHEAERMVD